jgi:hypothetical protein
MDIQDINSEQMLRDWLAMNIVAWNALHVDKVGHEWIEPTFGSSMGISDAKVSYRAVTWGVELKHWYERREGVNYKIRPVQRRYNVMGVKSGRKLLIMATVVKAGYVDLVLIRGDKAPLRDYCNIKGSGCEDGIEQTIVPQSCPLEYGYVTTPPSQWTPFGWILKTLSNQSWWN